MLPLIGLVIVIVVISAAVGLIAQVLNKLNDRSVPPPRRPARRVNAEDAPGVRPSSDKDMDRFLAEIDRLRRKNTDGGGSAAQPVAAKPTAVPVGRPPSPPTRLRPRVVAELADPRPQPKPRRGVDRSSMAAPPVPVAPGTLSPSTRVEDLPVAAVVSVPLTDAAPATITRFGPRARPVSRTDLGKNLTDLLNSGQGAAMAIVLHEVFGPPKSKQR